MNDRRTVAREMRQQGMSVKEIAKKISASSSSVSMWVRDIQSSSFQIQALKERKLHANNVVKATQANQRKRLDERSAYQEQGRIRACQKDMLHHAGCLLYWAEGAKGRNEVNFVNSDSNMMLLFVRFLRESMYVTSSMIALHIHCHATEVDEIKRIEQYWLELLILPQTALKKTQIKIGTTSRRNILKNGICGIKVHNTEVLHHIYGAIQEYGGFENPAWLS